MLSRIFGGKNWKIVLALLLSYGVVSWANENVFLAGTPRLNPDFIANLQNLPKTIAQLPSKIFRGGSFSNTVLVSPELLQPVAKGVNAYEDKEKNTYYIQYDKNATFKKETFKTQDGKDFTIYIPEGLNQ